MNTLFSVLGFLSILLVSSNCSGSSGEDDDDCGCQSSLTTIEDRHEIQQLIYGLQYHFDDATNGLGSVADFVSFIEENSVKNLTVTINSNVLEGVDAFTSVIGFIAANYQYHFIISGGVQFLSLTSETASTRVNQLNLSIQFGNQDYTGDVTFYDFEKINGKWKFTTIFNPINFNLCVVGSAYDSVNGCENPDRT